MARGINKVILVGNLGQDPETRYMPSGGAVTNITVATSESWKDKNTGQQQERTEWHRVVFFNRLAEIAGEYLKKGSKVYVEGALRTRKWEKNGVDMYTTEIVAAEMQMLDSRGGGGGGNMGGGSEYDQTPAQPRQQSAPQRSNQAQGNQPQGNQPQGNQPQSNQPQGNPSQQAPAGGFDDFDDDIPF